MQMPPSADGLTKNGVARVIQKEYREGKRAIGIG
jgi:hypothetical protein